MWKRVLIAALVAGALAAGWLLLEHAGGLAAASAAAPGWVAEHPVLGAIVFVVASTLGKVTPVPGGTVLLLAGGFLFGPIAGPLLSALGAALSAVLVAVVGEALFGEALRARFGERLDRAASSRPDSGFFWLLAARLMPGLPAWLINLLPLAMPVPVPAIFLATFLGLLPLALILGRIGTTLANLAIAESLSAGIVFRADVLLPLAGLALLSTVPPLIDRWRRRR